VSDLEVHRFALTVNGEQFEVAEGATIADLVALVTDCADPRGVAVAVDRCVVPRSEWAATPAQAGTSIEIVGAVAGG
jgi:sulfur carrier protein